MKFLLKMLMRIIGGGVVVAGLLGIGLAVYAATLLPGLPTIEEIRRVPLNIPLRIYNSDRQIIAEYGNERRIPVALDNIPPLLIDAVLVTEDDRFYHHTGVDFLGIVRATWSNFRSKSRAQGASTITMQAARNFFLTPERTYTRKLKEVLLAFNMERALTKDEILALYFNKIFLGHRAYGFAAAAQVYYGLPLDKLSLPELAMLAGLPKAPSRDNPITNPERALERRAHVLKRLHALGKIDNLSYESAKNAPVTAATRSAKENEVRAPYVAEMARQLLVDRFGERVYELGYKVIVTVNSKHQTHASQALRNGLLAYDRRHGFRGAVSTIDEDAFTPELADRLLRDYPTSRGMMPAVVTEVGEKSIVARNLEREQIQIDWRQIKWAKRYESANEIGPEPESALEVVKRGDIIYVSRSEDGDGWRLDQMPKVSGALVSMDAHSGAILALSGGFDYYLSEFNRATQALRQPGSNIKPFIYSAALANGFTAGSVVSAAPIVVDDELEGIWRPQNYSRKFFGPTRLREALSRSLNLVSVRLVRAIGVEKTVQHLAKFGFDPEELPRSLSLALGSIDVAPVDMAAAFAVFANGGKRVKPYLIEEIIDRNGRKVLLSADECEYCKPHSLVNDEQAARAISPQNAFLTSDLLQQVILTGTGRRALSLKRTDLAGKTGTTNNFRDAWFSGFNRDVVTTVFVGFDEPTHLGKRESGAAAALPIWVEFMREMLKDYPEKLLTPPENIVTRYINKASGELTTADDADGYFEYYVAGTEPNNAVTRTSTQQAQLTRQTNLPVEFEDDEQAETLF